jgi:alkylhydroperoxidase family enzyme
LCAWAEKLTRDPHDATQDDVTKLQAAGLSSEAISDAAQVIGYFNYINRIAGGLGVDLEPKMPPRP